MGGLNRPALKYLAAYEKDYDAAKKAAECARKIIEEVAQDSGALIHTISARAKTPDSLRGKFRRKKYRQPNKQVTDAIGVRVITYYRDAVDPVVDRLKSRFLIDEKRSVDKRLSLGLHAFGYRSVHLIAKLKPEEVATAEHQFLAKRWFEIQVRSILEHAWAEIEHETVYKSGSIFPDAMLRRISSLAGALELLDGEFLHLRGQRDELIAGYRTEYEVSATGRQKFDVARLLGFLEARQPKAKSWRSAAAEGKPFQSGLDIACVEALETIGLATPASLWKFMQSSKFRYAVSSFAASQRLASHEVSHLALVVLAAAVKDSRTVLKHFPEIARDAAIKSVLERRAKRST